MHTTPPVNTPTPPVAAVHYSPNTDPETAAYPWLIAADGEPLTRVAEPDQAAAALQVFPEIIAEGWDPAPAMQQAIEHADADNDSTAPATRSVSEEPGTGYAVTHDAEGRLPWIILDPHGRPVARSAAGDHALNALQALPDHLDQADAEEVQP